MSPWSERRSGVESTQDEAPAGPVGSPRSQGAVSWRFETSGDVEACAETKPDCGDCHVAIGACCAKAGDVASSPATTTPLLMQ